MNQSTDNKIPRRSKRLQSKKYINYESESENESDSDDYQCDENYWNDFFLDIPKELRCKNNVMYATKIDKKLKVGFTSNYEDRMKSLNSMFKGHQYPLLLANVKNINVELKFHKTHRKYLLPKEQRQKRHTGSFYQELYNDTPEFLEILTNFMLEYCDKKYMTCFWCHGTLKYYIL